MELSKKDQDSLSMQNFTINKKQKMSKCVGALVI